MILIVDDKAENIYSLKALLTLHSFNVDTASGGEEALKKILVNSYSLIMLDVQMPGMDGFEVAEAISGYSKSKDIPIIFLTAASTEKKYITKGYSSGGVDYITKPIDPDILLLKVKTLYRISEQNRKLNELHDNLLSEVEYRRAAEQKTAEKAAELRSILEAIPQLSFTTTSDGTLEYTNSKWLEYAPSATSFPTGHPDDADIETAFKAALAAGELMEMEVRIRNHRDSGYRYHLLRALPIREGDKIVKWVGTFTDIEEQKQDIRRKDEFISIASHELKTPLTIINAYVQMLEQETADNPSLQSYVERTLSQVKKLNSLIKDLLELSRNESGSLEFSKKPFEFETLLHTIVEMTRHSYPDYEIELDGSAPVMINGDESRIEQVLTNFISNAIKYSPESKKIVIETRLDNDRCLYVGVKDFGIGISETDQKKLFRKFYRTKEATSYFPGMGIGLFICSQILERHNARFGVNSEPGKGSTFFFTIPTHHPINQTS